MKKLIVLIGIGLCLSGCGISTSAEDTSNPFRDATIGVVTDSMTGCQYVLLAQGNRGGITPRLDSGGKPICSKK